MFFKNLLDKNPTAAIFEQHLVRKQPLIFLCFSFCDEKSVQLVRGASFQSDFLQNPYFKW